MVAALLYREQLAAAELFRERARNPALLLPEVSVRLSRAMLVASVVGVTPPASGWKSKSPFQRTTAFAWTRMHI